MLVFIARSAIHGDPAKPGTAKTPPADKWSFSIGLEIGGGSLKVGFRF